MLVTFTQRLVTQSKLSVISSQDETRHGMKKFLFTREFHPRMKRVEFHPGIKFNLKKKEHLPLSVKTYNKISH